MTTQTESQLERTVREEQEEHERTLAGMQAAEEGTDPDDPIVDEGGQTAIIDRSKYEREDLQIPKIDGQSIDRIKLKFTGEIHLDRSDASDVKLYNELRFGRDVELLIEARCNKTGAEGATDRDGDLDVVIGTKGIKIHSISKPAGADWVEDTA